MTVITDTMVEGAKIERGDSLLFNVVDIGEVQGIPKGARVKYRMRPDDFVMMVIRLDGYITQHAVIKTADGVLKVGPIIARNITR